MKKSLLWEARAVRKRIPAILAIAREDEREEAEKQRVAGQGRAQAPEREAVNSWRKIPI